MLVAVDFSERSLEAWRCARSLAKRLGSRLEAVHVSPGLASVELGEARRAAMRRELLAKMEKACPGASALHLEGGDVRFGILRTAARRRGDLLVAATRSRTGLRRLIVSSVAEELVRSSRVPVLVVRGRSRAVRSILAPINLEPYSVEGLRFAERVARALGARLSVLYVREGDQARPSVAGRLEAAVSDLRTPVRTEASVVDGYPLGGILDAAEGHGLVVMAAHRGGVFHDAVLGSTAEQVLRRAGVPVLCVPPASATRRSRRKAGSRRRGRRAAASRG